MRTGLRHDRATHRTASKLGLLLLLPAVAVGCSDQALPTASSTNPASAPTLSAGGNGVVLSASGSGHRDGALMGGNPNDTGWRTFSFTAEKRANGVTTRHVQLLRHGAQRQNGRVFCMADLGDGAILIGAEGTQRIPENQPPNPLAGFGVPDAVRPDNHGIFFVVKDNGEGATASAPDQFTGLVSTTVGFVAGGCALGPNHPLIGNLPLDQFFNDVEAGNIQVND